MYTKWNKDFYKEENKEKKTERLPSGYSKCKHDSCPECHGTGVKENGQPCIHMISCPCPKCRLYY